MNYIDKVIENNFCIGCGNCAYKYPKIYTIKMNNYGELVAKKNNSTFDETIVDSICPFSSSSKNEDDIAKLYYQNEQYDKVIGYYNALYAGSVNDYGLRLISSSGGGIRYLQKELLDRNEIDGIIHVVSSEFDKNNEYLFKYVISNDKRSYLSGSTSAYYPITLENVYKELKNLKGRYLFIGIPCFIKAVRLMSLEDEDIKNKIKYTIGIVCGGMKSAFYADMIGVQMGVAKIDSINYREKTFMIPPLIKGNRIKYENFNKNRFCFTTGMFGVDYGMAFFKPKACDYCDDIFAETADITFGDAWFKKYRYDWKGNNIVVVRNEEIKEIIEKGIENKKLKYKKISESEVASSQSGGIRHRRDGLAYRMRKSKNKEWVPEKRQRENNKIDKNREKIYDLREVIRDVSKKSYYKNKILNNDYKKFEEEMNTIVSLYNNSNKSIARRIISGVLKIVLNKIK